MQKLKPHIDSGVIKIAEVRSEMFNWSGVISQADLTGIMKMRDVTLPKNLLPCRRTMSTPNAAILADGGVRACFCGRGASNYGRLIIGNIKDNHVKDILRGEGHRKLVREWMELGAPNECKDCFVYDPNPISWRRVFELFFGVLATPSWWLRKLKLSRAKNPETLATDIAAE